PYPTLFRSKGREFVEGGNFLAGIGRDQAEAAVDRVTVGIDEAGEESLAFEIDALGVGRDGLRDFREVADGEDLVPANGNCCGIGILRIGVEDFGVEEDAVGGIVLSVQQRGGEKECCREQEKCEVSRCASQGSSQSITLSEGERSSKQNGKHTIHKLAGAAWGRGFRWGATECRLRSA